MKRVRPDSVLGTAPPFLQGNNVAELSQLALDVVRPSFARFFNQKCTGKYKKKLMGNIFWMHAVDIHVCDLSYDIGFVA